MSPILRNLLGNDAKDRDQTEEMRAVLAELKQERARAESLIENVRTSADRLDTLAEPIARAGLDVDAVGTRLADLEQRFGAISQLATHLQTLEERAEGLAQNQGRSETEFAKTLEDSQQIRTLFETLAAKVDLAAGLDERMNAFLEVDQPFARLHGEADTLRGQVESTGEHLARLREQHDRLLDAHRTAMAKMEALDRRRDELGRDLTDKERRVVTVEHAVRGLDGVQHAMDEIRREMQRLKATADLVGQKTAALEAQREAVDRALAQAGHLDQAMRHIDAGVRQQQDNEKTLAALRDEVAAVRAQHESVSDRSEAIAQLQRQIDERTEEARQTLIAVSDETKKTVERFDFERRGLESVTQRVADLRASLSDCEARFRGLGDATRTLSELSAHTQSLATRIQTLTAEAALIDAEVAKAHALRRDLDEATQVAREAGTAMTRIEQARPAVEEGLRDLEQLRAAHARVGEALERMRAAEAEIERAAEQHDRTRTWLAETGQAVGRLEEQAGQVRAMAPTIEFVQQQTQDIGATMASIEARREFVDDLERRLQALETLGGELDGRGRQLQKRMEGAEQRFAGLTGQADEAERMTMTVAAVSSSLNDAGRRADEIGKQVAAIAARSESVEALGERTQALRREIEQRQRSLIETAKDLERTTAEREAAADGVRQLEESIERLTAALSAADQRATRVEQLAKQLETRAAGLRAVKERLDRFDDRLTKWNGADETVARALEEIAARQDTVGALQADLDRMFTMAEQTTAHVRDITGAHREIEESRESLETMRAKLAEIQSATSAIDERRRQMHKAEERLARAEGLLDDVRSSLDALQGQKALVDQAVEKTGSLQFLLRQADAAIEGLREERGMTADVRAAVGGDDDEDEAVAA